MAKKLSLAEQLRATGLKSSEDYEAESRAYAPKRQKTAEERYEHDRAEAEANQFFYEMFGYWPGTR